MASIVVVRCEHCRRANEWRTPMVSVERVNAERERADRAERRVATLEQLLQSA